MKDIPILLPCFIYFTVSCVSFPPARTASVYTGTFVKSPPPLPFVFTPTNLFLMFFRPVAGPICLTMGKRPVHFICAHRREETTQITFDESYTTQPPRTTRPPWRTRANAIEIAGGNWKSYPAKSRIGDHLSKVHRTSSAS